jgi:hypothetical protein
MIFRKWRKFDPASHAGICQPLEPHELGKNRAWIRIELGFGLELC